MYKKAMTFILCMCMLMQSVPIAAIAEGTTNSVNIIEKDETIIDEDMIDISSYTAVGGRIVNDLLEQSKFTARQGHGFAAERGNNLIDRIKGKNAIVVGDNNVKNGPDRLIIGRDGTKIWIQDKYYANAQNGINACFDKNGKFRYFDGDGKPMQIEVPKDQYEEAVELMRAKIKEGKVQGVTDPEKAETLVRKGSLTYKQAQNLAKAGTIESLTYDAVNGIIAATCAMGISFVLNYTVNRINGNTRGEAAKSAVEGLLKTGGLVLCSAVVAGQLYKTRLMNGFAFLPTNLRLYALGGTVAIVVFSVQDAIDLFKGRISKTQFVKNFSVTVASFAIGTAGGIGGGAVGTAIAPGVGTAVGNIVGSLVGGIVGFVAADKIADRFVKDDAEKMYEIVQNTFAQKCEDYLITEAEAQSIVDQLSDMLDEDMFKDMYQSKNREEFIGEKLDPLFEQELNNRPKIEEPSEEEMREILKEDLYEVVFIH